MIMTIKKTPEERLKEHFDKLFSDPKYRRSHNLELSEN